MAPQSIKLNLVLQAAQKLGARTREWRNLLAFIESCYGGRVRNYDLGAAVAALEQLSEEQQHALISWTIRAQEVRHAVRR